ncbi:unnamed protein product, partial [marine sediment metagenome]
MTKKRWIGLLVVVALLLGIAGTAFAAPQFITQNCFTDVSTSDWFHDYVCNMYDLGVVSGYGDGTYRPTLSVTRAAMAVMLEQLSGYGSSGPIVLADHGGDIEIGGYLDVKSNVYAGNDVYVEGNVEAVDVDLSGDISADGGSFSSSVSAPYF